MLYNLTSTMVLRLDIHLYNIISFETTLHLGIIRNDYGCGMVLLFSWLLIHMANKQSSC